MSRADTVEAVLDTVAAAVPEVRAGLSERRHERDAENPSGEAQLAADVWVDGLLVDRIGDLEGVGTYASEERQGVVDCGDGLSVAVDPLDGSSNLASNNPVGTIVGVYDAGLPAPGRDLVAAAYVVYGPITTMTAAVEGTVTTDVVEDGERRTVEADQTLPEEPTVYGFGGGVAEWTPAFRDYAESVREELKLRYGGAFVADVNQVLAYGGVFAYPALQSRPEGKLRHQFEGAPVAYVVESAGGRSSDGEQSLLESPVADLHARTPVHVGSAEYVDRLESALATEVGA